MRYSGCRKHGQHVEQCAEKVATGKWEIGKFGAVNILFLGIVVTEIPKSCQDGCMFSISRYFPVAKFSAQSSTCGRAGKSKFRQIVKHGREGRALRLQGGADNDIDDASTRQ